MDYNYNAFIGEVFDMKNISKMTRDELVNYIKKENRNLSARLENVRKHPRIPQTAVEKYERFFPQGISNLQEKTTNQLKFLASRLRNVSQMPESRVDEGFKLLKKEIQKRNEIINTLVRDGILTEQEGRNKRDEFYGQNPSNFWEEFNKLKEDRNIDLIDYDSEQLLKKFMYVYNPKKTLEEIKQEINRVKDNGGDDGYVPVYSGNVFEGYSRSRGL